MVWVRKRIDDKLHESPDKKNSTCGGKTTLEYYIKKIFSHRSRKPLRACSVIFNPYRLGGLIRIGGDFDLLWIKTPSIPSIHMDWGRTEQALSICSTHTQRHQKSCENDHDRDRALDPCFGMGQTRSFFNHILKFDLTGS
jgi:hypothetical protein